MSHDANFKEYLAKLLKKGGIKTSVSLKVGKLPLEIDMVISLKASATSSYFQPMYSVMQNSGCRTFIIEYKSLNDRLAIHHLYKIIAYRALYLVNNSRPKPTEVGHLIITTQLPRKVLSKTKHFKLTDGIYLLHFELPIYLIVINYLPITKENFGLLFFSTGKKQYEFIRHVLEKNENTYFEEMFKSFVSIFYYEEFQMASATHKLPNLKKNIREAVHFLGVKEVVDAVGVKEVVDAVGVKEVVDAVGVKEVVDAVGVKEVVDAVGVKEVVDAVGVKKVVDAVGVKKVVDVVGVKKVIEEVGLDSIVASLSENELMDLKKRIEKKLSDF